MDWHQTKPYMHIMQQEAAITGKPEEIMIITHHYDYNH